jgi:hypothetical protein
MFVSLIVLVWLAAKFEAHVAKGSSLLKKGESLVKLRLLAKI